MKKVLVEVQIIKKIYKALIITSQQNDLSSYSFLPCKRTLRARLDMYQRCRTGASDFLRYIQSRQDTTEMYHYQDWLFLLDRSSLLDTHELHTLCHSTDNRSPMDMVCTRSHSLHPPLMSWCLGDTGLVREILVDNSDLVDRHYSTYCC